MSVMRRLVLPRFMHYPLIASYKSPYLCTEQVWNQNGSNETIVRCGAPAIA
jgi:hypothetical protein